MMLSRKSAADMFLSFEGRLDRERWLGGVAVLVVVLLVAHGVTSRLTETGFITGAARDAARTFVQVFLLFPWTALDWKRFHDHGRPGTLALICPGLFVLSRLRDAITGAPGDDVGSVILGLVQIGVALWLAYVLAYRAGSPGPNRFGPPPAPPPAPPFAKDVP
jgi:uncharacterized membrane protein YhaH (DUF805 family)